MANNMYVCPVRGTKNFRSHLICYISSYRPMSNSTDGGESRAWPLSHNFKKKNIFK